MKVVLFCGGLGTRLKEYSETIPKPMVDIGYRPIIWHLMKYYAHYGHKDFILCLGYLGDMIKEIFLNYSECMSNDFVYSNGGRDIQMLNSDIQDWRITFVETGLHANIGQRLLAVKEHLKDEQVFLANYSDGLSDLPLDEYVDQCLLRDKIASFVSVRTPHSFHSVSIGENGMVNSIGEISESDFWVNGGFFVLKKEVFSYMNEGEELVEAPFKRLIEKQQLYSYKHHGYWASMDTFKDKINFDRMYARGQSPWQVWDRDKNSVKK